MGRLLLLLFGLVLLLACSHVGHGWTMSGGGTSIPQSPVTRRGRLVKMQISASAGHRAVDFLDPREIARPSLQTTKARFLDQLQTCPFIAVLRGVERSDVTPAIQALAAEGVTLASVPAEAPAGIEALREDSAARGKEVMLGAATVISVEQVERAAAAGAAFVSCPHVDPEIIERATSLGLLVLPGVLTPTEAFLAVKHGACILKLFPSPAVPPSMVKSLRAVLPSHVQLLVSGGVQPEDTSAYLRAGAVGFALGSTLYTPGLEAEELRRRARLFRETVARGQETDAWAAATLGL